jgi:hypothetical protein
MRDEYAFGLINITGTFATTVSPIAAPGIGKRIKLLKLIIYPLNSSSSAAFNVFMAVDRIQCGISANSILNLIDLAFLNLSAAENTGLTIETFNPIGSFGYYIEYQIRG